LFAISMFADESLRSQPVRTGIESRVRMMNLAAVRGTAGD
jgi:hypothetical protein